MGRMRTRMGTLCTAEMCCVWMLRSPASAMAAARTWLRPSSCPPSRACRSARSSTAPSRAPLLPPVPAIAIVTATAPLFCRVTVKEQDRLPGPVPAPAGLLPGPLCPGEAVVRAALGSPSERDTPRHAAAEPLGVLGVPILPPTLRLPEGLCSHLAVPRH